MAEQVKQKKHATTEQQAGQEHLRAITSPEEIERIIACEKRAELESISLDHLQDLCDIKEEMGIDAPFATFTWLHWLDAQAHALANFSRFQRAIVNRELRLAMIIALEMQQIATDMQKEICAWLD